MEISNNDSSGEDPPNYDHDSQRTFCEESEITTDSQLPATQDVLGLDENSTQDVFMCSPVYDPPDSEVISLDDSDDNNTSSKDIFIVEDDDNVKDIFNKPREGNIDCIQVANEVSTLKRKATCDAKLQQPKIQKQDTNGHYDLGTQECDNEVMQICSNSVTATSNYSQRSKVLTPVRCSPRKVKRSNSCTLSCCDDTKLELKRTPQKKKRCASVDLTKTNKTPIIKIKIRDKFLKHSDKRDISKGNSDILAEESSLTSSEEQSEKINTTKKLLHIQTIIEESTTEDLMSDSQDLKLVLSPTPPVNSDRNCQKLIKEKSSITLSRLSSSEPIVTTDRSELVQADKPKHTHSAGYNYSDQSNRQSQGVDPNILKTQYYDRSTDQESTDSVSSMILDSPEGKPTTTLTNKMISNITKNNTSTPSSDTLPEKSLSVNASGDESDNTPDPGKLPHHQRPSSTNESYRTVTPSTISPLQPGHSHGSLPANTPGDPVFDIQLGYDEAGDFISMYVVRTDLDLGFDMCKEFQRLSKRYTTDSYLGDVSKNNSPSSVTSSGLLPLPNRISTMSCSSSGSSTRTSDGAFIIPHPPAKIPLHAPRTVRGYKALQQRVNEIILQLAHSYGVEDLNLSSCGEDKVSAGVQVTPGNLSCESEKLNGVNSPEEISRCDRATPKSSLKKMRGKGRRPLPGKTKRAILPTTSEEQEYMLGINSPEMVTSGDDKDIKKESMQGANNISEAAHDTPSTVAKFDEKKKRPFSPQDKPSPILSPLPKTVAVGCPIGTLVLAKWVDKRYYSGKIGDILDVNKFLVEFDDGHTKTLLDDFIIFGNMKELPLEGQSVYALVDENQNFEPALVLAVEENQLGTVCYRCTTDGDATVSVTATELYLTEDQARSMKESSPRSPHSAPPTPRRRAYRELDLDNIITGPRSVRSRNTPNQATPTTPSRRKMTSPKAGTSGIKGRAGTPLSTRKKRQVSECSEMSEGSNSGSLPAATPASPATVEVSGVEPEVQKTPRKIIGVEAGPLQLKGAAKQNLGKKNSKLTKFENDAETVSCLGPIPPAGSQLFLGLHFLLTCTDTPVRSQTHCKEVKHYSSEEDTESSYAGTDWEDSDISKKPFNKERLKEQMEAGGGVVYANFDDVPKNIYAACKLVAPRPCLTAKYIQCLAANIRAVMHSWVIDCCATNTRQSIDAFELPTGWSIEKKQFITWGSGRRTQPLKDKRILLCSDNDSFLSFWERVCTSVGATASRISEDDLNLNGAFAVLCEWDAPHTLQNKATAEGIPLVSTAWVAACLIEGRLCVPTAHVKYSFSYTEPD